MNYLPEKQGSNAWSMVALMTWNKMCHLREAINNNKNRIPPLWDRGNPRIKSMYISSQGIFGIGNGVYRPWGLRRDLAFKQIMQRSTCRWTSRLICGQKKWSESMSNVFFTPKWPANPPACASYKRIVQIEQAGMHNLLVRNKNPSCM